MLRTVIRINCDCGLCEGCRDNSDYSSAAAHSPVVSQWSATGVPTPQSRPDGVAEEDRETSVTVQPARAPDTSRVVVVPNYCQHRETQRAPDATVSHCDNSQNHSPTLEQIVTENRCDFSSLERKIFGDFKSSSSRHDTGYHSVEEVHLATIPAVRRPSIIQCYSETYPPTARHNVQTATNNNLISVTASHQLVSSKSTKSQMNERSKKSNHRASSFHRPVADPVTSHKTGQIKPKLKRFSSFSDLRTEGDCRRINKSGPTLVSVRHDCVTPGMPPSLCGFELTAAAGATAPINSLSCAAEAADLPFTAMTERNVQSGVASGNLRTWRNVAEFPGGVYSHRNLSSAAASNRSIVIGSANTRQSHGSDHMVPSDGATEQLNTPHFSSFNRQCDVTVTSGYFERTERGALPSSSSFTPDSTEKIHLCGSNQLTVNSNFTSPSLLPGNYSRFSDSLTNTDTALNSSSSFRPFVPSSAPSTSSQRRTPVGAPRTVPSSDAQALRQSSSVSQVSRYNNKHEHLPSAAASKNNEHSLSKSSSSLHQQPMLYSFYTAPTADNPAVPSAGLTPSFSSSAITSIDSHWSEHCTRSRAPLANGTPPSSTSPSAAKLKYRRRNILNLHPTMIDVDQDKQFDAADDTYGSGSSLSDETRSSGHASMSESHASSGSPPASSLPRDRISCPLTSVPEMSCGVTQMMAHSTTDYSMAHCSAGDSDQQWQRGVVLKARESDETAAVNTVSSTTYSSVPQPSVPHSSVPHSSVPHSSVPHSSVPHSSVPHSSVPHSSVPHSSVSCSKVSQQSVPPPLPDSAVPQLASSVHQLTVRSSSCSGSSSASSGRTSAPASAHRPGSDSSSSSGGGGGGSHSGCESEPVAGSSISADTAAAAAPSTDGRRLARHSSSQETINTNVTATAAADEFVWLDSHNRLVELQLVPWCAEDLVRVLSGGRLAPHAARLSTACDTVGRLSHMLQRALVRIARETQRLAHAALGTCTKRHVLSALRVVLAPPLAASCARACMRAGAMYAVTSSGDRAKHSKSSRAAVQLSVGRFHRWMCDVRLARFIHDYSAVYLAAAVENLFEEILLLCVSESGHQGAISVEDLDQFIASSVELWGLFQPHAHLNSGRVASGVLALPRLYWPSSTSSPVDPAGGATMTGDQLAAAQSSSSSSCCCPSPASANVFQSLRQCDTVGGKTVQQALLTTCVGSVDQLSELVTAATSFLHQQLQLAESAAMGGTSCRSQQLSAAISWSVEALHSLFYFMRCSQLEHVQCSEAPAGGAGVCAGASVSRCSDQLYSSSSSSCDTGFGSLAPVQQLIFERPYIVLPPLVEWVRVTVQHVRHRLATSVDANDVMQAARLLLPGVDCPPRSLWNESDVPSALDDAGRHYRVHMAFRLLESGQPDLLSQAIQLMLPTKSESAVNERDAAGVTLLMAASGRGQWRLARALLDAGAAIDAETPRLSSSAQTGANQALYPSANPEQQMWTALTFATAAGRRETVQLLLERGACVEAGARDNEELCTETPLQLAAASGDLELVVLLLKYGANPFLSTLPKDSLCYSAALQRGCASALSVAGAHGQRAVLHQLLAQPLPVTAPKQLSLVEMLTEAESSPRQRQPRVNNHNLQVTRADVGTPVAGTTRGATSSAATGQQLSQLSRAQVRTLQEAMYHCVESQHLEMTLDLRNVGVPWTLHCWTGALGVAHQCRLDCIVDQLLQDFSPAWPDDHCAQFADHCLPLLFSIFTHSKNEGTSLLLADIFSCCYGRAPIPLVSSEDRATGSGDSDPVSASATAPRIDVKYVNNAELSDAQFRVEGRVFYAHKIILVNASQRFRQMLSARLPDGSTPIVQINDIRYSIFQMVMEYLYRGDCHCLTVSQCDVLELMAAANFFQLSALLHHCEALCAAHVTRDNIVSMYIHAKVYSAERLLAYCQGFLLQNMVALLSYDDCVRRLMLGGRRLNDHDVVGGLLATLQTRCRAKHTTPSSSPAPIRSSPHLH